MLGTERRRISTEPRRRDGREKNENKRGKRE